jgi:hypothetical protein
VQLHPSSHAAKAFEPHEPLMTQACAWRSCTSCMHPGLVAGRRAPIFLTRLRGADRGARQRSLRRNLIDGPPTATSLACLRSAQHAATTATWCVGVSVRGSVTDAVVTRVHSQTHLWRRRARLPPWTPTRSTTRLNAQLTKKGSPCSLPLLSPVACRASVYM